MNIKNNIPKKEKIQEQEKKFNEKILKHLPKDIEEKAVELGVIERKREIKNAKDLLKMLMIYANEKISIKILSFIASALKIAEISDRAWSKKILKTTEWLKYILNGILGKIQKTPVKNKRKIKLIDCSTILQIGKEQNQARMHTCFNLNIGTVEQVELTDHHVAEGINHYKIDAGDIIIGDTGYCRAKSISQIVTQKADAIIRMSPNLCPIYDESGKKINIYKTVKKHKKESFELEGYVKFEKEKIKVRLIISPLPKEKLARAIYRKKRAAQKNKTRAARPETLEYAKWVMIITTLDKEYSTEDILEIYKIRWQIELLFKRMKQHLSAQRIPKGSEEYAKVIVYIWLITWSIVEIGAINIEKILINKNEGNLEKISFWRLCTISYKVVKEAINATIEMEDIVNYSNYLLDSTRRRKSQLNQWKQELYFP